VNPHLLLILVALLYVFIVGSLGALRREGFSLQFAVEVLIAAAVLVLFAVLTAWAIHPIFFLALLYLVTMRSRLLVDLANFLARRGYGPQAASLYDLALKLKPDAIGRVVVLLNQGVHHLKQDKLLQAIALLKGLLADFEGGVGPKYEAAARYNLGVAYQRHGDEAKAIVEFNKVIDVMPGSLYSLGAQKALERGKRRKGVPGSTDE
jgi:tetratricopeptide (TPR) repeat protein